MTDTPSKAKPDKGQKTDFDIAIVGGGLTGLLAAVFIAQTVQSKPVSIALIRPETSKSDGRTTAMLMPSVKILHECGLWDNLSDQSAPLKTMRLIDGSDRLFRAPVTEFKAGEIDLEAFGYNISNKALVKALEDRITQLPGIKCFDGFVTSCETRKTHNCIHIDNDHFISVNLVVAADGHNSSMRKAAGISWRYWSYPQSALVLNFTHNLDHGFISTEFHTRTGPFTQVPLPAGKNNARRSGLVWVTTPRLAETIVTLPADQLNQAVESKMQSLLGTVQCETTPQKFPLSGGLAERLAARRIMLIGEAAHMFPPIGAQGFNLGVRDIIALRDVISQNSNDPGCDHALMDYNRARQRDIQLSTAGIDVLNRSLLTDFLPLQFLRSAGMATIGNISWFRKQVMKHGIGKRGRMLFS